MNKIGLKLNRSILNSRRVLHPAPEGANQDGSAPFCEKGERGYNVWLTSCSEGCRRHVWSSFQGWSATARGLADHGRGART